MPDNIPTSDVTAKPAGPRRGSLLVIFLTVFIDLLGFAIVIPILPIYGEEFARQYRLSEGQVGWLIGTLMASFSAMQFLFAPVWGKLSDRYGRRPVLMVGLAGSVVFYLLFGVATVMKNLLLLFVARIGAGIAGATIPTAQAYIADTTTLEGRAKGMALIGAAFGLGFTFGPLFGFLAVPSGEGDPGPGPGYAAAALSLVALLLAIFKLPESLNAASAPAAKKLLDWESWREALGTPSIGPLLLSLFVCIFAFANFETTLSMLIKDEAGAFRFTFRQVCLTFAYIGVTLAFAQGFLVRRLSGRVKEAAMATAGAVVEIGGFWLMTLAIGSADTRLLFGSLTIVVIGFALTMPSLNSLISRRSDPARQGGILGVAQSVSALARILGPLVAIPLLKQQTTLPYYTAAGMMLAGLLLILAAARGGKDYAAAA
jgi:MFS family permease